MKLLTNKNFTQKIIVALVIVILFNFISPQISFGKTGIGGVLFEPIKDLVLTIADGAVWLMQKIIFGTDVSLMKMEYDKSWISTAARSNRRGNSRNDSDCCRSSRSTIFRRFKFSSSSGRN